ncbi:hypothetical protein AAE961_07695 [Aquirufa sp. 2-BAHN-186B]|uniref:Uncharacterized protein n=1 Tax=Aquirufa novilacunae TaxID=3139305 RepID=A0ABW8U1B3_9BACT
MNFDIVITSCIYPNTFFINSNLTINDRILNTHDNLKWICEFIIKENIQANIYLLESSFIEINNDDLIQLIPAEFKDKIIFTQFCFTDEEKLMIREKGKGYSELLMLKKYVEINNNGDYFLKISGRYKVTNISKLFESSLIQGSSDIILDYSFFFKKCSTIIFCIRKNVFLEYFLTDISLLDDKSGMFIERYFLSILKSPQITKAKFKIRPNFPVFLKSGSYNSTYTFSKQLITDLIYKFP